MLTFILVIINIYFTLTSSKCTHATQIQNNTSNPVCRWGQATWNRGHWCIHWDPSNLKIIFQL